MRTLAHPLALLIVITAPIALVGAAAAAVDWGRWMLRSAGIVGVAGIVLTGIAVVNLGVPRRCATTQQAKAVNRPIISLATDDGDCERAAVGWTAAAVATGVAASGVVEVLRRSRRRAGAGAAPSAPTR